uniref:Peptidase S1 domain-containing protein n=1 Tax=Daphnia galeata TaxID=27404 RepID=A0A8J2RVT1_9CRUS|nr:unnamed protein product [Daphnia galeata]
MMGDQIEFSKIVFLFAMVTLLSSPVSSFVLPRVTRTDNAIIIDLSDDGYAAAAAPHLFKNNNAAFAYPGFLSQMKNSNGWSYFFGYPSLANVAGVLTNKQFDAEDEQPAVKQSGTVQVAPATAPAPAPTPAAAPVPAPAAPAQAPVPSPPIQCGRGPAAFPKSFPLISERVAPTSAPVIAAKKGVWPFIVTLKDKANVLFCAGSLISDTKVLTAAQCLEDLSLYDISGVTVSIGVTSGLPLSAEMTRRIGKIVLHSGYNAANFANDIAIITLDSPVIFSRSVAPICLPPTSADPDQYADRDALILGWGTPVITAPNSALLQAKVGIVSNSECRADADIGKYVSDGTVCVSSTEAFSCDGDVGGPVVINTAPVTATATPAVWTIAGINSYTKAGCRATGLKTRVSAYIAWINLYMN